MPFEINLNTSKYVLIASDSGEIPEALVQDLLQTECHLTIISPFLDSLLIKQAEKGYFGYLAHLPSTYDLEDYHWNIIVASNQTWKKEMMEYCRFKRRLVTDYDDDGNSDVYLGHTTGSDVSSCPTPLSEEIPALLSPVVSTDTNEHTFNFAPTLVTPPMTPKPTPKHSLSNSNAVLKTKGTLYLVGVGLGSPDLLTLRAHSLIHTCPVIISDRLVDRSIYDSLPSTTRLLFSRKVCGKANLAQDEINDWIVESLKQGIDVMRAKGGDPFVFGRGGEEWEIAHNHGFEVKWVPGISSSIAAAGAAGIPITHRGVADSFVVATGQKQDGSWSGVPFFSPSRTLVLLMSMGVLENLGAQLQSLHGYPADSRVAVIYRASYSDQKVVKGSLMTIAAKVKSIGITSHATVVVGKVVDCLSSAPVQAGHQMSQ